MSEQAFRTKIILEEEIAYSPHKRWMVSAGVVFRDTSASFFCSTVAK